MTETDDANELVEITADIISAYVSNNSVSSAELPKIIGEVFTALRNIAEEAGSEPEEELTPAVNPKRSVTPDYIICLEDGKKFKSLKRHLSSHYDMTPEQYRERWGLPADYPMVAPNYAAARSALARKIGLGQRRTKRGK